MDITNEARDLLKKVLRDQNSNGIRIYFVGHGCEKQNMGMALDEPKKEDKVVMINDIQVAVDPQVEPLLEELVIEYDEGRHAIVIS
jgi:Fe-S cluster assembly iron-binding protein IscA